MTPEEVAGIVAGAAEALARWHEGGEVHGQLDADQVVVSADGSVRLLGRPRPGSPEADLAALVHLARSLLAPSETGRQPRVSSLLLPPALTAIEDAIVGADSAGEVADRIRHAVPGARPPGPRSALSALVRPERPRRSRRPAFLAAGVVAVVLVIGLAALSIERSGRTGGSHPSQARARPGAVVPLVVVHDAARYTVGEAQDDVEVGDWACRGHETPVLLRRPQGRILAYPRWPADGAPVAGVLLGRVADARRLAATDDDGDGCPELWVERTSGPPVPIVAPA